MSKCRLGCVIGLTSPNLCGPRHLIQWASKFTRKLVKSSLEGDFHASSEMLDHMSVLREFYRHFTDCDTGEVGLAVLANQKEQIDFGEVSRSPFFGDATGNRNPRIGQCMLDPGKGESGRWPDHASQ